MVEPIRRVTGPSGGLDAVAVVHRLAPVERDERDRGERDRRRRKPPPPAAGTVVEQGEDGRPHVDVRA